MAGERIEKIGRILASMDSDICLTPFDEKVRDVLELVWEILKEKVED